jgi:tetratricopeptide (TPR) repeat protein
MKKLFSAIVIVLIFLIIIFFVFTDKSYRLTKRAEEYYRESRLEEAEELLNEALQLDKFNRKAIILKTKINKELELGNNIEEAEGLYKEAVNDLENEKFDEARIKLMRCMDLVKGYSSNDNLTDYVEKLKKDIVNKMNELNTKLADIYIKEAQLRYNDGDLIDAYELLESIEFNDNNIEILKSKIAFEIGEKRYYNILGADFKVNELEIRDAIYWFSRVSEASEYYNKSRDYIKGLRKYINK